MVSSGCCVPLCTNRGGHKFPTDILKRKRWMIAIKRDKWRPTTSSVVCKEHFKESDYISETVHGSQPLYKKLKPEAVPSVFTWTQELSSAAIAREERTARRSHKRTFSMMCDEEPSEEFLANDNIGLVEEIVEEVEMEQECDTQSLCDTATQTLQQSLCDTATQTPPQRMFSVVNFVDDPSGIHFYTGLETYEKFEFVLRTLGPAAYHLNYTQHNVNRLDVKNQFFLVLIKLRQHKTNFELSRMFGISDFTVANVVITWINFMAKQWQELNLWPSRDLVKYFAPTDFRAKFPTTRVIIDGTECPIKKPKAPLAQQATFSTYKNRNTVKTLIGATPGGLVSYISPAYSGATSDRQIVERTCLIRNCDPGDSIMADKGFNVQDLFAPGNVTINIPTFFRKRNRMSGQTVLRDRKISSKRVHIERIIGLGKTYKILAQPMNSTETKLSSEIIFICFMLCNFRNSIVPDNA